MEDVVWYRKPLLSEPVAILAFEGWSDAGNTATGCVENLSSTYDVDPFAELNSDSYYNYQMRRPVVEVKETEPPSSSKTTEVSNEVKEVQFVTKVKEVEALDKTEATSNSVTTVQEVLGDMMGDAPACPDCGHITIRNGSCYKCLNCGNSLGCS